MRRREFVTLLGGAAAALPLAARAQQRGLLRRIGVLMSWDESDPEIKTFFSSFMQGLAKLGWTDGGNGRWRSVGPAETLTGCGCSRKSWLISNRM